MSSRVGVVQSGPTPKPTELKLLEGNPGRRRIKREPKPRLGVPKPPAQLDARARREYLRIADEMQRAAPKLFTQLDGAELAVYAQAWSHWLEITSEINARRAANKVLGRWDLPSQRDLAAQLRASGDRLGLSPAARTRLSLPDSGGDSDDLLN